MRTTDPKKLIKAIQTGRRKLGMTDDEYRGLLSGVSGGRTASTRELTEKELVAVLARMRKAGFEITTAPQLRKIWSLWLSMHGEGVVRDRSDTAIRAYIQRITGEKHPENYTIAQLQMVIETLKKWIDRIEDAAARERLHQVADAEPATLILQQASHVRR